MPSDTSPPDRASTVDRPPGHTDADRFAPTDRFDRGLAALPDRRDDPEEITLVPRSITGEHRTTAWITADVDDVLDLSAMR